MFEIELLSLCLLEHISEKIDHLCNLFSIFLEFSLKICFNRNRFIDCVCVMENREICSRRHPDLYSECFFRVMPSQMSADIPLCSLFLLFLLLLYSYHCILHPIFFTSFCSLYIPELNHFLTFYVKEPSQQSMTASTPAHLLDLQPFIQLGHSWILSLQVLYSRLCHRGAFQLLYFTICDTLLHTFSSLIPLFG